MLKVGNMQLNLTSPLVREWFMQRKEKLRPWTVFFAASHFKVLPTAQKLGPRILMNLDYFQTNYLCVYLTLILYCLSVY